ncbi:MAG TPA: thioredoxin [Bacillota bacterium]|nr:thioredoxin [Fastidiosipila sp.]HPX93688.1 thioredoxin [Bacillota bacterium]HQB81408.1 thioredoxin [Bacillota bacterium]
MMEILRQDNFEEKVIKSDLPVLIDFWAEWCGPCRMVAPVVEELAKNYAGKAVIGKVNVDEERGLAQKYRVFSIPTLFIFKGGKVVDQLVGARPYDDVARVLDKHVG